MILLCPLEFESRALRSVARARGWSLVCTGPGDGPARWVDCAALPPGAHVVLAGVAAGLAGPANPGTAWLVTRIRAEIDSDDIHHPSWVPSGAATATIACVHTLLRTPAEKARTAACTGASLADMESAAFARSACAARLHWGVVRGVSDGPADTLPADTLAWTDGRGRTQLAAVARSLLRSPRLVPQVARLGRNSAHAMQAVARLLAGAHNAPPDA